MLCSALASSRADLQRQQAYKSWLGTSGAGCHLTPNIEHLQKMEIISES